MEKSWLADNVGGSGACALLCTAMISGCTPSIYVQLMCSFSVDWLQRKCTIGMKNSTFVVFNCPFPFMQCEGFQWFHIFTRFRALGLPCDVYMTFTKFSSPFYLQVFFFSCSIFFSPHLLLQWNSLTGCTELTYTPPHPLWFLLDLDVHLIIYFLKLHLRWHFGKWSHKIRVDVLITTPVHMFVPFMFFFVCFCVKLCQCCSFVDQLILHQMNVFESQPVSQK